MAYPETKNGHLSPRQPVSEPCRLRPLLQVQLAVDRPADVGKAFVYVGVSE